MKGARCDGAPTNRSAAAAPRPGDGDISDDLVNRAFDPAGPDRPWCMDVTLRTAGLLGSMGTVGDCYATAVADVCFSGLQRELLDQHHWATREQLALAIFGWIETWYNPGCRHSYNHGLSPIAYETANAARRTTPIPVHETGLLPSLGGRGQFWAESRLPRLVTTMEMKLLDSTVAQTREVAVWVTGADPLTPVPTCPAWTLADLVNHVGATQRWVTKLVSDGVTDPGVAFSIGWEQAPAEPEGWSRWLADGADGVAASFSSATDGRSVFDPSGGGDGVAFWSQRIFGEIAVHRIDAAVALHRAYEIDAPVAAAAVQDWLNNMASPGWAANVPGFTEAMRGDGQTIAWVSDDTDDAWLLRRTDAPLVLTHDRADADVTIHGPVRELLEIVSRRRSLGDAQSSTVVGDRNELMHLIDHMNWIGAS
jgi:uncharacterized protein (TIGR03083 family)